MLDIERDPAQQGFAGRRFDVVLAANVLHATADLREVLNHVRELLVPGGLLILAEVTRPEALDRPDVRAHRGLVEVHRSCAVAPRRRFCRCVIGSACFPKPDSWARSAIPSGDGAGVFIGEAGIVAKTSESQSTSSAAPASCECGDWLIFADRGGVGRNLAAALEVHGERSILVLTGDAFAAHGARRFTIDPTSPADHERP